MLAAVVLLWWTPDSRLAANLAAARFPSQLSGPTDASRRDFARTITLALLQLSRPDNAAAMAGAESVFLQDRYPPLGHRHFSMAAAGRQLRAIIRCDPPMEIVSRTSTTAEPIVEARRLAAGHATRHRRP